MVRSASVLALSILASLTLSGCLADDIWREPYSWGEVAAAGENVDAAQAFAGALAALPDRGAGTGGMVVDTVEDLPDNIVFQNLKQFVDSQAPGRGEQVEGAVRVATGNVSGTYYDLTGQVADAWAAGTGDFLDGPTRLAFPVADQATRLRLSIDVALAQGAPEGGTDPTPLGNVEVRLTDARGAVRLHETLDTTRHIDDMFIVGTYGGTNEVREDLSGTWTLEVSATGEGAWSVTIDAYTPTYDDYESWQFWRGDRREVTG